MSRLHEHARLGNLNFKQSTVRCWDIRCSLDVLLSEQRFQLKKNTHNWKMLFYLLAEKNSELWLKWNGTKWRVFSWEKQELWCLLFIRHCGMNQVQTHNTTFKCTTVKQTIKISLHVHFSFCHHAGSPPLAVSWGGCHGGKQSALSKICS